MNYLPATEGDRKKMLDRIGVEKIDDLLRDIPEVVRLNRALNIPPGMSEYELKRTLLELSNLNRNIDSAISFLGAGAYDHYMPMIVDHMMHRSEWYTSYTPYQPEISQGTLQNIFEFQTMVCELFGLDAANASVYDGASALGEAMLMACDRRKELVVSKAVHPEYRQTLETYTNGLGVEVKSARLDNLMTPVEAYEELITDNTAALVVQYPNFFGNFEDVRAIGELAHAHKALLIVVVGDITSLSLFESPGSMGADIVVGDGMSLAGPANFGGTTLGMMACTQKLVRRMPGRIAGMTTDAEGNRAFVLTLQAREQHIRREKALSNVCSNQALFALAANMTLSSLGTRGLQEMAVNSMKNARYAVKRFTAIEGVELLGTGRYYNEFALKLPVQTRLLNKRLLRKGIFGCVDIGRYYPEYGQAGLFYTSEFRTRREIDYTAECMEVVFNEQKYK